MPDKTNFPKGFSFTIPPEPPPGSRKVTAKEAEEEILTRLKQKEGELREAMFDLVNVYNQTGQQKKALPYIQRLVDLAHGPGEKARYLMTSGQLMEGLNDFAMAVEYYSRAHAMEPTDLNIWYFVNNNLGYSLNQLGRCQEAERFCREAIKTDPKRYNAYKNLGIAMQGQEKYVEAADSFIQSVKANAGEPRALNHLSDLLRLHPELLTNNPHLVVEMQHCREANALAAGLINELIRKYYC